MASNVGEMSGMKDARHMILWLFFGLLPMLGSCDFRDMLDDYPVSGVQIKLDWKGVPDKLPQTMRIIFYPKDTQGRKVESYLPAGGGEVKVPPGKYAVVAYNFNTESIQIRGDESYETIEAFTGHCTGLDVHEDMVWSPDPLYVVALDEVEIRQSDVALPLDWKPEAVVDLSLIHIFVDAAKAAGISAVIAADVAVMSYARQIGQEVHLSTQLNISNVEALRFYAQFADVVVLARELNLEQVAEIYRHIREENICGPSGEQIRIEMFCHGALCMAVSGKCYLSLHEMNHSANRGACMQVCRRSYTVRDKETDVELEVDNQYICLLYTSTTLGT